MKAVIFSLDGTLLDVLEGFYWQFETLTEEYDGEKPSREAIAAAAHGTTEQIVRRLVKNRNVPFDEICQRHAELRATSYDRYLRLYPGVPELLHILRQTGVKIGALTSGNQLTVEAVRRTGIEPFFQTIVTASDVEKPKPDPEGMFLALDRLGVPVEEAMMVGDSTLDVLVGKKAGLAKTVAVTHGFGRPDDLRATDPDHVIHDIPTLLDVVWSR